MGLANRWWLVGLCVLALAGGCDDNGGTDAGPARDAGGSDGGFVINETDAGAEDFAIPGLDGEVEVIVDERGMPHIYATTIHDLMVVQGYLMSRDRFIQMELLRRQVLGRLTEVVGVLAPDPSDDIDQRFFQFENQGRAIYESLPADDRTRLVAEAFVEGINHYIDTVVDTDDYVAPPGHDLFNAMRASENFGHWEPHHVFAVARFQSWNLAYDAFADIGRTEAIRGVRDAFDPADADARLAARAGIFGDFWSAVQARRVYTRDGFPDGTTTSISADTGTPRPDTLSPIVDFPRASLRGGLSFFERVDRNPWMWMDENIGSNSWVVSGEATESGNAILSNDPHLSLIAPGVWWYVHLNTARMGGEDDIDAQGVAFAALPGVVLGYNRTLAWSATTTGYDVTDAYAEEVTFRNDGTADAPDWVPVSVAFEGGQVDLDVITETVVVDGGDDVVFDLYSVPHHGTIIPDSIVEPDVDAPAPGSTATGSAMSVRYTGDAVSNELQFFVNLLTAETVEEGFAAAEPFEVGIQNFSMADSTGAIGWTTHGRIPQRACNFWLDADGAPVLDAESDLPLAPLFVMPGGGGYEWGEDLAPSQIPHDVNPSANYIATANQVNVGVTEDGNPCNDGAYIGGAFAVGYRMGRIVERLDEMVPGGAVTVDDMIALQHETRSSLGEGMRDAIVASLDHALGDPSDDPALQAVVDAAGTDGMADVQAVRDRLAAWTFATPHGVDATDDAVIADSVATSVFNSLVANVIPLAFDDEEAAIGSGIGTQQAARMMEWALMSAEEQQALPLYTYAEDYAGVTGYSDTVVWDDLTTDTVVETRDERVTSAALAAVAWLTENLGDDWDQWRWGRLHAVRFQQIVVPVADPGIVSIPPRGSEEYPIGFPRDGDYGAVDVMNFGLTSPDGIQTRPTSGRGGPSQRLVVEMTADGPLPFNALPGGQVEDPDSPHHDDEAMIWITNERPPLWFERADIESHAESMLTFTPGS